MKDIQGYEGLYKVTEGGKIWSCNKQRFMSPITKKDGVQKVSLSKNGQKKQKSVHRLVAETFIDNPENKPQVDHIDGNKQNNNAENLRWCTNEENQAYRWEQGNTGAKDIGKPILWGDKEYPSIRALAREIAAIRGSKEETVRKELKAVRYGPKTLYGKYCEIIE
jgi:hypothetical protein